MKKGFVFGICLVLIVSISFVSAGWFSNWVGKITGNPIEGNESCSDSDGENFYVKGYVNSSINGTNWDFCSGSSVIEYVCYENQAVISYLPCDFGCSDGACISAPENDYCTDSDGGFYYYEKGYVNSSINGTHWDYCTGGGYLAEYYCSQNIGLMSFYDCPDGCSNGACLNTTQNPTETCTDSDGGVHYYLKGYTNSSINGSFWDYCSGNYVIEYSCYTNENYINIGSINCPDGCSNGACLNVTENQTETCYDSDGGINYNVKGETYLEANFKSVDFCMGSSAVEYYCDLNLVKNTSLVCSNGCLNGICLSAPVNITNQTCYDSDGGIDYYVKGVLSAINGSIFTDYCAASNLVEYSCDGDLVQVMSGFACPYGCLGGVCLSAPVQNETNQTTGGCEMDEDCEDISGSFYCVDNSACSDFVDYSCVGGSCVVTGSGGCSVCQGSCDDGVCENVQNATACNDCFLKDKCYPMGYRRKGRFCSEIGEFEKQLNKETSCENNFECKSNLCLGGNCISESLWKKFLEFFRDFFNRG